MRKSQDSFAGFLEAFPEAVIIHDGETITHVNRAGLGMFGADSSARMVGMHMAGFLRPDFYIPFDVIYKPFDYAEMEAAVEKALADKRGAGQGAEES